MSQVTTLAVETRVDKRLITAGLLIVLLAGGFWSSSRYPDLNRKAAVGGDMGVTGISFDIVARVESEAPLWKRTGAATLNWIETNKKGMSFGIAMAAAMLTLLGLIGRRSVGQPFGNSLIGVAVGAPMGLCVNCATPIATALHRGGARLETSLSMLVSSPTLNVIVLSMLLAFFPWYMWATKIAGTIAVALVATPLLSRFVFRREAAAVDEAARDARAGGKPTVLPGDVSETPQAGRAWGRALLWTARTFLGNLWWVARTAVPLMLLAGLLGSLVITLAPWDLFERLPFLTRSPALTLGIMALMAVVATFLPVPMAFDVILTSILFERGLPAHYAMVLLFTLGSFSVYPFLMLRKAASLRVAASLFAVTCAVGFTSGIAVKFLEDWHIAYQERLIARMLMNEPVPAAPRPPASPEAAGEVELAALLDSRAGLTPISHLPGGLDVERHAFRASAGSGSTLFTRHDGSAFGLDVPAFFSPRKLLLRSAETNRPIASGDVHGDGWPDLLIGGDHDIGGLVLFANVSGRRFVRQRVELGALANAMVQTAALVDLDGDGWLDIFFTTFAEGNYVVPNRGGRFADAPVRISRDDKTLANAAAFGDIDRDGRLDVVIGNWTMGYKVARGTPMAAADRVLLAQGGWTFTANGVEGPPGYTLSTLLTDFDGDGALDLIVGNDFEPDNFYVGSGSGSFRRLLRSDNVIPATGLNTMSVTAADIDNDLKQELYIAMIAIGTSRSGMLARRKAPQDVIADLDTQHREALQQAIQSWPLIRRLRSNEDISAAAGVEDPWLRQQYGCFGATLIAMRRVSSSWASLIPPHCGAEEYLDRAFSGRYTPTRDELARRIPATSTAGQNLLLKAGPDGAFVDRAQAMNAGVTDWTWNAKFADLDNDGWQDLYAANGWVRQDGWESNVHLRNVNGTTFRNDTTASGLTDHLPTSGYTYVDLDRDGDLDIVSVPVLGPIRVFINNSQASKAIQIVLRDEAGNSHGIGSTVTIAYGGPDTGERHQMRELQAGGGFVSFDETMAHFGLGSHDAVSRITVRWSTGETTTVEGPLPAGHRYVIHRRKSGRDAVVRTARR